LTRTVSSLTIENADYSDNAEGTNFIYIVCQPREQALLLLLKMNNESESGLEKLIGTKWKVHIQTYGSSVRSQTPLSGLSALNRVVVVVVLLL
jgi:hypothetical protein